MLRQWTSNQTNRYTSLPTFLRLVGALRELGAILFIENISSKMSLYIKGRSNKNLAYFFVIYQLILHP